MPKPCCCFSLAKLEDFHNIPYKLQQFACLLLKYEGLRDRVLQMALPNVLTDVILADVLLQSPRRHNFPHHFLH